MARGRRKPLIEQYRPYLNKLMGYKHGQTYNKDKRFTEGELLDITPSDVAEWMNLTAYGVVSPGPDDKPTRARHSGLEQAKKAVSYFMPHRDSPWNVQSNFGNPTRATPVNNIIKAVKRAQVRKEGKASQAKRDLKRSEFRKTIRLMERNGDHNHRVKIPSMLKSQFHIIGRADDICNVETADLRSHDTFRDFALQTKVSWSKNVMEERDCPDQILLGAQDTDFCVLLGLACYLESRFTLGLGDPRFLFGERADDDEPDRINGTYCRLLRNVWGDEEFLELLAQVRGSIGSHSLRKFAATWAAEHACSDPEVEIRGRWKGKKNGRIVNRYISVEQLPTDAKVAGVLCVGGAVKYSVKAGSHVTQRFLREVVCPGIDAFFVDESNNIAEVLGAALLWACHEPSLEGMMADVVRNRVREGFNLIRGEDHPAEYNPVQKIPLQIYRIENMVHIDELLPEMDQAGGANAELFAAQGVHAQRELMQNVLLQLHHVNQRQAELANQLEAGMGALRVHFGENFQIINRNVRRIGIMPPRAIGAAQQAAQQQQPDRMGELSPFPRNLFTLWTEYMYGVGGRKPAKDFTAAERGRQRHKYCRRKVVWEIIGRLVRAGYTAEAAIGRIHQSYGHNLSVTKIIDRIKRDKRRGGHPNLRTQQ